MQNGGQNQIHPSSSLQFLPFFKGFFFKTAFYAWCSDLEFQDLSTDVYNTGLKQCVMKLINDTISKYKKINRSFQLTCVYRHQLLG